MKKYSKEEIFNFFNEKEFKSFGRNPITNGPETDSKIRVINYLVDSLGFKKKDIYLEYEVELGSSGSRNKYVDIVIFEKNKPIHMIEVKPDLDVDFKKELETFKTQLFNLKNTIDGWRNIRTLSLAASPDEFEPVIYTADAQRYQSYEDWQNDGFSLSLIESDKMVVTEMKNDQKTTDMIKLQTTEMSIRKNISLVNNYLWNGGKLDDHSRLIEFVKILYAKIYDELNTSADDVFKFQILNSDLEDKENLRARINKLISLSNKKYVADAEIKSLSAAISNDSLFEIVKLLSKNSLHAISSKSDVIGEVFEKILDKQFKQTKGQFFTNAKIVDFIGKALQLKNLVKDKVESTDPDFIRICDPSAGSGAFLTFTSSFVSDAISEIKGKKLSVDQRKYIDNLQTETNKYRWTEGRITGYEQNDILTLVMKLNLILHGIDGEVSNRDSISDRENGVSKWSTKDFYNMKVNEIFDVIVTNPPFSLKITKSDHENFILNESSHYYFIERWYQLLKTGGRVAAVLPESVFDGISIIYPRIFMSIFYKTESIVSLGEEAFKPFTGTKTSIWIAQKRSDDEVRERLEDYRLQLAEANILQSKFDKKTLSVSDVSLLQDVLPISYENIYDDEVAKDYFSYKKKKNDLFGNGNHKLALAMYTRRKCDEPVMFFNPGDNIGYKRTTKTLSPAANDLPKIIEMMDGYVFSNAKNYLMPEQNNQLMVIKTFAELTKSVSSRIDVNNAFQLKTSTYLGRFLTKAQHETEILPEGKFEYVEIGDVDNFGQVVETHTLDGSIISEIRSRSNLTNDEIKTVLNYEFEIDDSIEIALYAKVIKGDIFKPSLGEVLVSKTRPNLKKIVLVDERVANVYFTKGFIPFVTRDINPESSWNLIMKNSDNLLKSSRNGGSYPTLVATDVISMPIASSEAKHYLENNSAITKSIKENVVELDKIKKRLEQTKEKLVK